MQTMDQTFPEGHPFASAPQHAASERPGLPNQPSIPPTIEEDWEVIDARPILPKAAFFMGDLRDGLPMVCVFTLLTSAAHT
jgi:hypothetical protein